jgi:hypothetical protein
MMSLWKSRNMQYESTIISAISILSFNDPSVYYSASCVKHTPVCKVYEHRSDFRDDKAISNHETASGISISCALFIPYRVTSFLNMQGTNGPRHELGKHYFHYEYHTDRVPITTV